MWIQLLTAKHIELAGQIRAYHAGDFVDIGKQQANAWIADGSACLPGRPVATSSSRTIQLPSSYVAVVPNGKLEIAEDLFGAEASIIEGNGYFVPRAPITVVWDGDVPLALAGVAIGFSLLKKFEILVPMYDYKMLAVNFGSDHEKEITKEIIRDLRVPVYDTRLMFVKKTTDTVRLFKAFNADTGEDRKLAFLRALYQVKPFILALPATWAGWQYV